MGTVAEKFNYLNGTKTAIKDAIVSKGVEVSDTDPFRSYADKINQIDEWKPQPDWWDIDKILEEDTEDYPVKMIALFGDANRTSRINKLNADKIVTSDGTEYTTNVSHTWDTTKDKECSQGYKTRYIIWYYSNTEIHINDIFGDYNCLYYILKNATFITAYGNRPYYDCRSLECIKMINCTYSGVYLAFNRGLYNLQKIDGLNLSSKVTMNTISNMFNACKSLEQSEIEKIISKIDWNKITSASDVFRDTRLEKLPYIDTSNIKHMDNMLYNAYKLKIIENLDFSSAVNVNGMFIGGTDSLIEIKNISNIKISGLNFAPCMSLNHDTLIRILNALHDYASEGSTDTYTIIFGPTNLAKLTDEEKAIATTKGWTLS